MQPDSFTLNHPIIKPLKSKDLVKDPLIIPEQIHDDLRLIRNKLFAELKEQEHIVVGLTSSTPGEGTTTNALKLALSTVELSKKTLLIDASETSGLTQLLHLESKTGIHDLAADRIALTDIIHHTDIENLACIPTGTGRVQDLTRFDWSLLLSDLMKEWDVVYIDLPSVSNSTLAFTVSSLIDGIVLVVAAHQTRKELVTIAIEGIEKYSGKKITGMILNRRQYFIPKVLYHQF